MKFIWQVDELDVRADDRFKSLFRSNPNHEPAGSPDGGQFTSGGGGEGSSASEGGGHSLKVSGTGDNHEKVQQAIDAIPKEHISKIGSGLRVINKLSVTSSSGRNVAGLAVGDGASQIVQVADQTNGRKNKDPSGTTVHEIGHALDNITGHELSKKYGPMIRQAADKMRPEEKYLAQHYFQNDREMFAEVYKLAYSPSKKGAFALSQKSAEKRFASVLDEIRAIKI